MARQATPEEKEMAAQMEAALQKEESNDDSSPIPETTTVAGVEPGEPVTVQPGEGSKPSRKRGRPSDAERALRESVGAVEGGSTGASSGTKRGPRGKSKSSDPTVLARSLLGIHQVAAMILRVPEVQLSEQEGQLLAEAVVAVCEEYGLSIDGKTGAAMQLFGAAAMIYAPRVFAYKMRIAQETIQRERDAHGTAFASSH
ncbi:MAG TPA: hypothetical protein VJM50_16880 [Pyrinomonadaceae bacterium]|nr:hypothetical protein [Pyrinomonadaceae bacterium]